MTNSIHWEYPVTQINVNEHRYKCPITGKYYKAQGYSIMRDGDGYRVHAFIETSNTNPSITKILDKSSAIKLKNKLNKEL